MKFISHFFFLAIVLLIACSSKSLGDTPDRMSIESNPDSVKQLIVLGKAVVVDVRTPAEFAGGHIQKSINIPLQTINDSLQVLKRFETIVVVCRSGGRSAKSKVILNDAGFTNVIDGGGWKSVYDILKQE